MSKRNTKDMLDIEKAIYDVKQSTASNDVKQRLATDRALRRLQGYAKRQKAEFVKDVEEVAATLAPKMMDKVHQCEVGDYVGLEAAQDAPRIDGLVVLDANSFTVKKLVYTPPSHSIAHLRVLDPGFQLGIRSVPPQVDRKPQRVIKNALMSYYEVYDTTGDSIDAIS